MANQPINSELIDNLKAHFRAISDPAYGLVSDANITKPPTDAELDSAYDSAANLEDGFIGIVDDNGAGSDVYLVVVKNSAWWYASLTKAV